MTSGNRPAITRRSLFKAGAATAVVAGLGAACAPPATAADGGQHYWIGDSIGTSWWSDDPEKDSPPGRLSVRLRADGRKPITNLSVGGLGIHDPANPTRPELAYGVIDRSLPAGADTVVIALGANDLGVHRVASELWGNPGNDARFVHYMKMEMIRIDGLVSSRANRVVWQTILPVCAGGYCTEPLPYNMGRGLVQWYDVNPWTARLQDVNGWLMSMWPDRVVDVTDALRPDANGWAAPVMFFDGLHPNQWGCQRIADAFPLHHFS